MTSTSRPEIAVIGGSGLYEFLDAPEHVEVPTPYGQPSAPISVGRIGSRQVAFVPRHGTHHEFPPHRVNYQANLWALRSLGVRRVLAPCAVGSLQPHLGPGALVVPDQLVDRTTGRIQTFMDSGAAHVGFADPYCPDLRRALTRSTPDVIDGGTMVVIGGPRFSTRAESQWYASFGWLLVNMTGHPEAVLARELAMCYAPIALVTDRDAGIGGAESVSQAEVFAQFGRNVEKLRTVISGAIASLSEDEVDCECAQALDGIKPPFELP